MQQYTSKQRKVDLVIDLGFGSSGKGNICGYLSENNPYDTVCLQYSMNAGHTYISSNGNKFIHMAFPIGVFSPRLTRIMWGPGSVLNMKIWKREYEHLCEMIPNFRAVKMMIHPNAAIIEQRHMDEEAGPMTKIGSTKKGCGAAVIERIRRDPDTINIASRMLVGTEFEQYVAKDVFEFNAEMDKSKNVLVESCQGYSLSLYHGFTPYTTSRDVSTAQIIADCAIPLGWGPYITVIGVHRTFPIRVANRYDADGKQVGWSGPCYPDQTEIQWSDLGLKPEITTVTKLPRRVFDFSQLQLEQAIRQNGVNELYLNFMNYITDVDDATEFLQFVSEICSQFGTRVRYVGVGPEYKDLIDLAQNNALPKLVAHWAKVKPPLK